jgi:hypothetical protein
VNEAIEVFKLNVDAIRNQQTRTIASARLTTQIGRPEGPLVNSHAREGVEGKDVDGIERRRCDSSKQLG